MDSKIYDDQAKEAAEKLIRYCEQTGCLYCRFVDMEGPDIDCDVRRPREWRIKDDE